VEFVVVVDDDDDDDVKSSSSFIHPIWSNVIHKPGEPWKYCSLSHLEA